MTARLHRVADLSLPQSVMKTCLHCVGSRSQAMACVALDCPTLFTRHQAVEELHIASALWLHCSALDW